MTMGPLIYTITPLLFISSFKANFGVADDFTNVVYSSCVIIVLFAMKHLYWIFIKLYFSIKQNKKKPRSNNR